MSLLISLGEIHVKLLINTVNGTTYIRNVKFLKPAPIDERDALLFDDQIEAAKKVDSENKRRWRK